MMREPYSDRHHHPPVLESVEILVAVVLVSGSWFVWEVAHERYHLTSPQGAIDERTSRHPGYAISLSKRWLVEKPFGWLKQIGPLKKVKLSRPDFVGILERASLSHVCCLSHGKGAIRSPWLVSATL